MRLYLLSIIFKLLCTFYWLIVLWWIRCVQSHFWLHEWTGNPYDSWTKALHLTNATTGQDAGETMKTIDGWAESSKPATTGNGEVCEQAVWSMESKEPVINWVGNHAGANEWEQGAHKSVQDANKSGQGANKSGQGANKSGQGANKSGQGTNKSGQGYAHG